MHKPIFLRLLAGLAVLALLLSFLAACTRPDSGAVIPPANRQQQFQLQGRIQQGPSAGLNFSGELRTTLDAAHHLQGLLVRESGLVITVTGQIDGQAIHVSFDLGNNISVLGVGTLQHSIDNPQGTAGGLLTGPQPGDSGDWFARWTTILTPATPSPSTTLLSPDSPLLTVLYTLLIVLVIGLALIWLRSKQKNLYRKSAGRSSIPFVKASAQTMQPEHWPAETTLPLAQFATTYAHGDDHYDLSFTIESARGDFLGECGVGISTTVDSRKFQAETTSQLPGWLESTATAPDHCKSVTALEVWIFDKNDINTVTTVLRSARGFYNPSQRSAREPVSDVLVIEPDQTVVLETQTLRLRVNVIAVEYLADAMDSSGVFKQVSLKLAVWAK